MINDLMKFVPAFQGLTPNEIETLCDGFVTAEAASNSVIFKAGDPGESLYMIGQGFVNLTTDSDQNLATLGPGSMLGDASLFRGTSHDVSAVACSDLEFWKLSDEKLRSTILAHPVIGIKLSQNFGSLLAQMEDYLVQQLSNTKELNGLPSHTLKAVASALEPATVAAGQAVYQVGEKAGGLYLMESGSVELRPEGSDSGDEVEVIESGALFGALALLTDKPHSQSAVVRVDSLVWRLPADQFQSINSTHPGLRRSLGRNVRARLSTADQSRAGMRLAQMPLFQEAPPAAMQAIAQRMVLQHVPAGERVYMVGEGGDAFYLVESGEIELTAENASGVVEELARVADDGFFGEMSLLTGQIRTEDATATRNSNLWVLFKTDLDDLSAEYPEVGKALSKGLSARLSAAETNFDEARFRKFELLAALNDAELGQIAQRLQPTRYRMGEQIYRASTAPEMLFLLEKGQVRVQPLSGGSWLVGPGESFGERALLTNQPHNASVLAESDVDVWTLSKQDFDQLMNQYPQLAISMSRMLSQRLEQGPSTQEMANVGYMPAGTTTAASAPRQRQSAAYSAAGYDEGEPQGRPGFGQWFSNLSRFGKLRFALLILLLIWLLGIAAPAALISLMRGASLAEASQISLSTNALRAVYAVGSELAAVDQDGALAIALADSRVQATPTYTPPPTSTPIPTSTPLPTNTPTVTPRPTNTRAPVIVQQQFAPPPTATPEPVEEVKAAAVQERPRAWDPRLDRLGIRIEDAPASPGQQYWRLVEARWWNEQESGGKHHIYAEVLDENGNRLVGHPVKVWWGSDSHTGNTEAKAPPEYGFNYQMYAAGNAYSIKVEGLPSDMLHGLGMGDLERRDWGIHTSFLLTFRKSTRP